MKNYKFLMLFLCLVLPFNFVQSAVLYSNKGDKLEIDAQIKKNQNVTHSKERCFVCLNKDKENVSVALFAKKKITQDLSTYGYIHYFSNLNELKSFFMNSKFKKTDFGYFGIRSKNFGEFEYSRNNGVMHDLLYLLKMDNLNKNNINLDHQIFLDNKNYIFTYRTNNSYFSPKFLNFSLELRGNPLHSSLSTKKNEIELNGIGCSIAYNNNKNKLGFSSVLSYFVKDRPKFGVEDKKGRLTTSCGLSMKYDFKKSYMMLLLGTNKNIIINKFYNSVLKNDGLVQLIAGYNFDKNLSSLVSFSNLRENELFVLNKNNVYQNQEKFSYHNKFKILTNYSFNKNLDSYLDYTINLSKINNSLYNDKQKIFRNNFLELGLRYHF
ncbi:MAG: porin [Buchnera aphidicola (Tetraneura akinire)]